MSEHNETTAATPGPTFPLIGTDVMILAAGMGTRMQPLTAEQPKPLLLVQGRPLLAWNVAVLARLGARRIVINAHHCVDVLDDFVKHGLEAHLNELGVSHRPEIRVVKELILLGTAGGLANASPLLRSDPVLTWNVDLLFQPNIDDLFQSHAAQDDTLATLVLTRSPAHAKIRLNEGRIEDVAADADPSDSALWAFTGVALYSQDALCRLPSEFAELPGFLREWSREGRLRGCPSESEFLEIGTLDSYLRVHRRLAAHPELLPGEPGPEAKPLPDFGFISTRASVHSQAKVSESVILPGARLGAHAQIERAIIGPKTELDHAVFGEAHAYGSSARFPILDAATESVAATFLDAHASVWPKASRHSWRSLTPVHGGGSTRQIIRVTVDAHSHILIVPESGPSVDSADSAEADGADPPREDAAPAGHGSEPQDAVAAGHGSKPNDSVPSGHVSEPSDSAPSGHVSEPSDSVHVGHASAPNDSVLAGHDSGPNTDPSSGRPSEPTAPQETPSRDDSRPIEEDPRDDVDADVGHAKGDRTSIEDNSSGHDANVIYPVRQGHGVPTEAQSFVYAANVLSRRGVRVPSIRVHDEVTDILLVEDLGSHTLEDVVRRERHHERDSADLFRKSQTVDELGAEVAGDQKKGSSSARGSSSSKIRSHDLYRQAVDYLVQLQRPTEPFDPDKTFAPPLDAAFLLQFEAGYFQRKFVEGLAGLGSPSAELQIEYEKLTTTAASGRPVLVHRDYQSRNLMVTGRGLTVIDFQGCRMGPPLYDLASLLHDPYVALDDNLKTEFFDSFCERAEINEETRTTWSAVSICRLLQALGAFSYLGRELNRPGFLDHAHVALEVARKLSAPNYPHLGRLLDELLQSEQPWSSPLS